MAKRTAWRGTRAQLTAERDQLTVELWNVRVPIGAPVIYTKDDGTKLQTRTRSEASMLSGHTPVVWLEDVSGCVLLTRVAEQ